MGWTISQFIQLKKLNIHDHKKNVFDPPFGHEHAMSESVFDWIQMAFNLYNLYYLQQGFDLGMHSMDWIR